MKKKKKTNKTIDVLIPKLKYRTRLLSFNKPRMNKPIWTNCEACSTGLVPWLVAWCLAVWCAAQSARRRWLRKRGSWWSPRSWWACRCHWCTSLVTWRRTEEREQRRLVILWSLAGKNKGMRQHRWHFVLFIIWKCVKTKKIKKSHWQHLPFCIK